MEIYTSGLPCVKGTTLDIIENISGGDMLKLTRAYTHVYMSACMCTCLTFVQHRFAPLWKKKHLVEKNKLGERNKSKQKLGEREKWKTLSFCCSGFFIFCTRLVLLILYGLLCTYGSVPVMSFWPLFLFILCLLGLFL